MPETDVIFKFEAQDDLSPILDKIRDELDAVTKSTQQVQSAISKAVTPSGGGAGGGEGFEKAAAGQKEFARETKEAGFAMEQMKELMAGVGYTIGAWNIGFFLAEKAVDAVTDGFKNASTMQQNFVEQMNITRSSTTQERVALDELKKAAEESGMSLGEDFTKFVMPTTKALENLGLSEQQAAQEVRVLGQYMRGFGVDMRDLATKTELGTASFDDLLKAGAALGPMFEKEVLDWKKFEIGEAQANTELQRYRQLMNEAYSDTERLASAHEGFTRSTGLASAAFQAFRDVQRLGGGEIMMARRGPIPAELLNLPGGVRAFGQLMGELQAKFKTGIQQIAKEEGLSERLVTAGVKAGLPGFDEQALLAAQKRAVEEREIARHRGEETEDFERKNAAEQERIKLNREVTGILKEQAGYEQFAVDRLAAFKNYQESILGTTNKIGEGYSQIGIKIGDAINNLKELSTTAKALETGALLQAIGSGIPGMVTSILGLAQKTPEQKTGAAQESFMKFAQDETVKGVTSAVEKLTKMLEGH